VPFRRSGTAPPSCRPKVLGKPRSRLGIATASAPGAAPRRPGEGGDRGEDSLAHEVDVPSWRRANGGRGLWATTSIPLPALMSAVAVECRSVWAVTRFASPAAPCVPRDEVLD
jgi:hypothetical protein